MWTTNENTGGVQVESGYVRTLWCFAERARRLRAALEQEAAEHLIPEEGQGRHQLHVHRDRPPPPDTRHAHARARTRCRCAILRRVRHHRMRCDASEPTGPGVGSAVADRQLGLQVPLTNMDAELCKAICHEYRIHNANVNCPCRLTAQHSRAHRGARKRAGPAGGAPHSMRLPHARLGGSSAGSARNSNRCARLGAGAGLSRSTAQPAVARAGDIPVRRHGGRADRCDRGQPDLRALPVRAQQD
jgi:hypothetical protein